MNRAYNCKVSSKNSKPLLKNLQNTVGDYFFLPHPVELRRLRFDLIFTYKLVFGLIALNMSDFFILRSDERNRGHKYKLFIPSCSSIKCKT